MDSMLSGLMGVGDSMFESLGGASKFTPDPTEMRMAAEQAKVVRKAELKAVKVCTYDLSDPEDSSRYCRDRETILTGVALRTHYLIHHERQFVNGANPRWVVHMEWGEFTLKEQSVDTMEPHKEYSDFASAAQGDHDEH